VASLVTPVGAGVVGGAQAFLVDLAQGLARRGGAVTVYCAAGSRVPGVELVEIAVDAEAAREGRVMPGRREQPEAPSGLVDAFGSLFKELRARGADAVSSHAFDAEAIELAEGLPVLHTLHLPPISEPVLAAARRSRARFATVSRNCARAWAAAGVECEVLRNGVPEWQPAFARATETALLVGRLSPEKGFGDGVRAARLAGLSVVVAGDAYDPSYQEPLLAETTVVGPLDRTALSELMARSAVLLAPVKWEEPFGLAAAEAQMAGCPVAGYRRGALPEVVEDGVSGHLVEPDDVAALAEAARRCLSLDRRAVHASARSRLGLEKTLDAYEAALG
jgi:glycosyltransferase involved in cell wall biosynthesis